MKKNVRYELKLRLLEKHKKGQLPVNWWRESVQVGAGKPGSVSDEQQHPQVWGKKWLPRRSPHTPRLIGLTVPNNRRDCSRMGKTANSAPPSGPPQGKRIVVTAPGGRNGE
jgi:hypothetical protein